MSSIKAEIEGHPQIAFVARRGNEVTIALHPGVKTHELTSYDDRESGTLKQRHAINFATEVSQGKCYTPGEEKNFESFIVKMSEPNIRRWLNKMERMGAFTPEQRQGVIKDLQLPNGQFTQMSQSSFGEPSLNP